MFTIEQRDQLRDHLLEIGRKDGRIVSCAIIGSTAGGGDRWSDLDLSFALADNVKVDDVLSGWTARVEQEFGAVHLFDLPNKSSVYRVFLFPGNLQVDLSFTPGAEFGALGPKFLLQWGAAVEQKPSPRPSAQHFFGLGVHHVVRARVCLERGRFWQAEYWISAARDCALSLACLRLGLETSYGRGFDDLPTEILEPFAKTLVCSFDRGELLRALGMTLEGLLRNSKGVAGVASRLEAQLRELVLPF